MGQQWGRIKGNKQKGKNTIKKSKTEKKNIHVEIRTCTITTSCEKTAPKPLDHAAT